MPDLELRKVTKWGMGTQANRGNLVITGPAGTGKTYFCSAMIEYLLPKVRYLRAYNERDLLQRIREFIGSSAQGDYLKVLQRLIDDDVIIIDDIGSSGHTQWREEVLLEVIDYRYENELPTIFTSNLSKDDFYKTYGQRIASRLFAKENTIIELDGMSDLRAEGL